MGLAGFSLALSIITNYVETGRLRRRGSFQGRTEVKAQLARPGSIEQTFIVQLATNPVLLGAAGSIATGIATNFLYDIFKRTVQRNIGVESAPATPQLEQLESDKLGDLEALASATEPAFRQAHTVIGNGAKQINIYGGNNKITQFTEATKDYVNLSINDREIIEKDVSVAAFNANSGVGRVYDQDYGRTIPIYLTEETFATARPVLGWGLNEYSKGTGKKRATIYLMQ